MKRGFGKIRRALARVGADRRGGVAIWFGLAAPVVAIGALGVVDYGNASMNKTLIQDALDAAALIAARSSGTTSAQIDATGDAAFKALLPSGSNINGFTADGAGRLSNVTFTLSGSTVTATATGSVTPLVSNLLLGGPVPIHANSEVIRSGNKLEIAMVLDTTGSMRGTKLSNLITSAKGFVTSMEAAAARSTDTNPVKISIVPFAMTVRVQAPTSMASYNTSTHAMTGLGTWLDGRARSTPCNNDIFTNSACSMAGRTDRFSVLKTIGRTWDGCIEARISPYDIRDTAASSSDVNTLFTPYFWPDEPDTNSDYLNDYLNDVTPSSAWKIRQGYAAKYNTTTFKSTGNISGLNYDYGPNAGCEMQTVKRLSTNFAALRTHIDGLVASGNTDVPLGLMWGWHTLSPNAPFADGVAYGTQRVTKIIVLMTDGDNTYGDTKSGNKNDSNYEGYGYIWQNKLGTTDVNVAPDKLDYKMVAQTGTTNEALCSNIKARNILIYTVGVGVSTHSRTILQNCATTTDNYYDVNSTGSNLNAAFDAIAGSIQNLRISR